MEYAVISTVNNLDLSLHNKSKYLMCLAWLAQENSQYKNFFSELSDDKFIILDNGANESKMITGSELINAALTVGAAEVIAPDVLRDGPKTIEETSKFLDQQGESIERYKLGVMGVVHGRNIAEIYECAHFYAQHPLITTIGIGFRNCDLVEFPTINITQRNSISRLLMTRVIDNICKKPIHLLGNYNPLETRFYKDIPNVRSTDSSSPVLCGHHDIIYDKKLGLNEKPSEYLDFFGTLNAHQVKLAKANIDIIQEWISE